MNRILSLLYFSTAFFIAAQTTFAQTNSIAITPDTNIYSTTVSLRAPAVSEINGKIDYAGGNMNSEAGNNLSASITLPVTHQFGFQADALYSRISDLDFYGGAGHFFWRDPGIGLLGFTGGFLHRDTSIAYANTFQAGAEGQFYWHQFTFGFFGGVGSIDYRRLIVSDSPATGGVPPIQLFVDPNPTRFIGRVSVDYYPLENLRVGAAYINSFGNNLGKAEIEYQTPINGLALTGEVAVGDHGYDDWLLGLRYYFGGKKTLRERQRQDDPPGLMPQILQSFGLYGAEDHQAENNWLKNNNYNVIEPGTRYWGGGNYGLEIGPKGFNGGGSDNGSGSFSGVTVTTLHP